MNIRLLAVASTLLLGACSVSGPLADQLTTFNEAQEKASNQVMLLNILRSEHKEPRAYSHFDVLRGGASVSPGLSISIPFGPGAGSNGSSTGIGASASVSHDVKPQDDQDFYRGILTPVTLETWALYQDQNWPDDLLFHMFVEDIKLPPASLANLMHEADAFCAAHGSEWEFAPRCDARAEMVAKIAQTSRNLPGGAIACAPIKRIVNGAEIYLLSNDPGEPCDMLQFDSFVQSLVLLGFHIAKEQSRDPIGPAVGEKAFSDLDWPFKLKDSGIAVDKTPGGYQISQKNTDFIAKLTALPAHRAPTITASGASDIVAATTGPAAEELDFAITTRSPDGMIYYLGEVGRAAQPVMIRSTHSSHPLLEIDEGAVPDAAVQVQFHDKTYSIPGDGKTVSMQAFELLKQVFALYNKTPAVPSTTAVTVVN